MGKTENLATADVLSQIAVDPLLCDLEMPLRATFHPQGFSVEILTNSSEVLAAAEESWGDMPRVFPAPALQFRVGVSGEGNGDCPALPTHRAWRNLLVTMADAENFAVCDLRLGQGFAWVTRAALEERAYFRYHFLEGSALSLIEQQYLTPLHAACVQLNRRGVLLCGDSGAGKSSLAYACALRGWTFIADDASSLIRNRHDRMVIGNPRQMRFREAGIELFPELRRQRITPRATGEMAIELATETVPEIATALTCPIDYIVFLNRREPDPPGLIPFPQELALSWFGQVLCYGEQQVRECQIASLRHLLTAPVLELRYRDLDYAVDRLGELVRAGD